MAISSPFLWHCPKSDLFCLSPGLYYTKSPLTSPKTLFFQLPSCFINQNLIYSRPPDVLWAKTPKHQVSWWRWGRSKADLNAMVFYLSVIYLNYESSLSNWSIMYHSHWIKFTLINSCFIPLWAPAGWSIWKPSQSLVRVGSVIKARCRLKESRDVHMLWNWKPGLLQYNSRGEQPPWAELK